MWKFIKNTHFVGMDEIRFQFSLIVINRLFKNKTHSKFTGDRWVAEESASVVTLTRVLVLG